MVPLRIPSSVDSEAERLLFDEFASSCPNEWIILHSLDLAQRGTGPLGEVDFVVIAPPFGILVIEAKTYLGRTAEGEWLTHPTGPPHSRSPFDQASIALYRIKEWLTSHRLADVVMASVVMVPGMDIVRGRDQIEWSPRQLIDRSKFLSKSLEQLVIDCLQAQKNELTHPPRDLSPEMAERILGVMRGEVECYASPKARLSMQLDQVCRYTNEQFTVLDMLDGNDRLLIDGLAGTGKTLLAIESARRSVDRGRRVLFVCFNRLLAGWLKSETEAFGDRCKTTTVHEFMQELLGDSSQPGLLEDYWDRELPERVFDLLAERAAL
ncbi:MAG: NERD domain-containing protein, partial [Coriobacteriia bacterium]|nr:NERD domain-containing protein [Coriobacteriia bacterium]